MASPKLKPTIILVHGAWHRPIHFQLVTASLASHGYKTLTPALPSVDLAPEQTLPSSEADIAAVRETIVAELDSGHDVILAPHSYGGIPASGALQGLDPATRSAQGKSTAVRAVAAIASFILPAGDDIPAAEQRPRPPVPDLWGPPPNPGNLFWHDIAPESDTHAWALGNLNTMSMLALYDQCKFAAWTVVPVHYLVATGDKAIPVATQERMLERIRKEGGQGSTERLEGASHSPFLARVEETVGFLRRAAGEDV
jgi:pimeloyl-ACP methyl ester carboxylesterase